MPNQCPCTQPKFEFSIEAQITNAKTLLKLLNVGNVFRFRDFFSLLWVYALAPLHQQSWPLHLAGTLALRALQMGAMLVGWGGGCQSLAPLRLSIYPSLYKPQPQPIFNPSPPPFLPNHSFSIPDISSPVSKLGLVLFPLCLYFIYSLVCLLFLLLSFPLRCLWLACIVCSVFLVVGCSLGCLVRFSFN